MDHLGTHSPPPSRYIKIFLLTNKLFKTFSKKNYPKTCRNSLVKTEQSSSFYFYGIEDILYEF